MVAKPAKRAAYHCCLVDRTNDPLVKQISTKVKERLKFSNYLIDPNRFNFSKVVRIMSLVIKSVKIWLFRCYQRLLQQFSYQVTNRDSVYTNERIFQHINMKHDPSILSDVESCNMG